MGRFDGVELDGLQLKITAKQRENRTKDSLDAELDNYMQVGLFLP